MIRIARPPEPPALAAIRSTRLVAAASAVGAGNKIDFSAYDAVKPTLADMQQLKCCYCEKRQEQAKYRDVEHYRPKSLYWWLAWTWENLLFACIDCNREQKRDQFPLTAGDVALRASEPPPGGEHRWCSIRVIQALTQVRRSCSGDCASTVLSVGCRKVSLHAGAVPSRSAGSIVRHCSTSMAYT